MSDHEAAEEAPDQLALFENPPAWTEHWQGMPEFAQSNLMPQQAVIVNFRNKQDRESFEDLVGQHITDSTKFIWFPEMVRRTAPICTGASSLRLRYPVYIISKGRWESRQTSRALERINMPYRIVIEPQEYDQYAAVIDPKKILVLPFSNLGQGSIPARNWVWEHSIGEGAKRH